ncbi:NAD(P)/FAD-dependent oxidoreductase [Brevibacterium sp.]|uniref:flavin-containing monooxygenase n=1 Tax=Brevibacterium sp. TaxID=1701 RepID=UPI002812828A|nr:NAD(P)/FAD-dependent oxidoreductase [Brevibacterium sp.]
MSRGRLLIIGGGQSGLAAARAGLESGWDPLVLEAGPATEGSWPRYYDSLRLFSPRRFCGFPGRPFPGDPAGYPSRDEVAAFLRGYADRLGIEVRTGARVLAVTVDGPGFVAELADGGQVTGDAVIAATGSFARPHLPHLPGQDSYGGRLLHVADYRSPERFAGQRVLVVGAGNSAVQVGCELAEVARTSLAVRSPIRFAPQVIGGRDLHWWLARTRADFLPPVVINRLAPGVPVIDSGRLRESVDAGRPDQRRLFSSFTSDGVVWDDGADERVDSVVFATGYRPHLPYLSALGVLDEYGLPRHRHGISTDRPGLGYLGLEFQRSISSNTLRGVHRDAFGVIGALTGQRRRTRIGQPLRMRTGRFR